MISIALAEQVVYELYELGYEPGSCLISRWRATTKDEHLTEQLEQTHARIGVIPEAEGVDALGRLPLLRKAGGVSRIFGSDEVGHVGAASVIAYNLTTLRGSEVVPGATYNER